MNILLYYPRLFIALIFQPIPRSLSAFHHWNQAQAFWLWNEPWDTAAGSLATHAVRLQRRADWVDANDPQVKRSARRLLFIYLFIIVLWPFLSLLISIQKQGWRFLNLWNVLVDTLFLYADRPRIYDAAYPHTLTHLSLYIPHLYIKAKTGQRFPDDKLEVYLSCRKFGISTPHVYRAGERDLPPGKYIVKPIHGFDAQGIVFTSEPELYLRDKNVIVQQVVRNPPEMRRLWGTEALATIRMMTLKIGGQFELAGRSHLRVPVGDAPIDSLNLGSVCTMIDPQGRLQSLLNARHVVVGDTHHPTTGLAAADFIIPRYEECVQLAIDIHRKLAPYAPFFNSDVTVTEEGPMLIEINRIPGLRRATFDRELALKFVTATTEALEQVARGRSQPAFATEC